MLCDHCESPKIVAIKGRQYCINCGNAAEKPDVPKPAVKKTAPVAAKVSVKASPKPEKPPKTSRSARLGDLSPQNVSLMASRSFGMLFKHHLLSSGIISDLLLASVIIVPAIIACSFAAKFSFLGYASRTTLYASIWAGLLVFALILRAFYSSAMTYGLSKQLDHRHQHIKWWRQAARRSLVEVYMLRLLQICITGLAVLAQFGLVAIVKYLPVPGLILPITFAASLVLLILTTITVSAIALARPAVVADQVPFVMAVEYSLIVLKQRTRGIISGALFTLGAFVVGVFVSGAGVYALIWTESQGYWQLGQWTALPAVTGSLILVAASIHFAMLFSLVLWLQIHQKLSRP